MNPEDKIVDAINRNTEAIQRCSEEIDKFRSEVGSVGMWLFFIWIVLLSGVGCPRAKATPLLPPLGYEIGETPAPPPNPNVQYWHTMDVPGPDGVLPQEVFAPRLVAQVASETQVVDVPEPGTLLAVPVVVIAILVLTAYVDRRKVRSLDTRLDALETTTMRYHDALEQILISSTDEYSREVARKALEESK